MHRAILIVLAVFVLRVYCSNAPFRKLLRDGKESLKSLIEEETSVHKNKQLNMARRVVVILIEAFEDLNWIKVVKDIKENLNPKRYKAVLQAWSKVCMFSGFRNYDPSEFVESDDDDLQAWRGMEAIISGAQVLSEWELLEAAKFLDTLMKLLEEEIDRFRDDVAEMITGVRLGLDKILTVLERI